ncbi:MAG TPA: hypothetical protein VHB45_12020, partial [Alloacidobacterium sp.]|nr:hypothetical protein [Alloacidobacterium sp.]
MFTALLLCFSFAPFALQAQAPQPAEQQPMGGNSTGGVHAAVHDSENRPITAGGFVDSGPVVYKDVS